MPEDGSSQIRFEVVDNSLCIRGSVDLTDFGHSGRYLNGILGVLIEKQSGKFDFRLHDWIGNENVWLGGKALRELGFASVTDFANQCPEIAEILEATARIEINDSQVICHPHRHSDNFSR